MACVRVRRGREKRKVAKIKATKSRQGIERASCLLQLSAQGGREVVLRTCPRELFARALPVALRREEACLQVQREPSQRGSGGGGWGWGGAVRFAPWGESLFRIGKISLFDVERSLQNLRVVSVERGKRNVVVDFLQGLLRFLPFLSFGKGFRAREQP